MPSDTSSNHGIVVFLFVGLCTVIGLYAAWEGTDIGILVTWFWAGIGLAGIYLLTIIVNTLEELQKTS